MCLLVDDLIATGGTACAGIRLMERAGAEVIGCSFVIDLPELGGADKLRALGKPVNDAGGVRRALMLKLYGNPLSPFARKACVIAHAHGIELEQIDILPRK